MSEIRISSNHRELHGAIFGFRHLFTFQTGSSDFDALNRLDLGPANPLPPPLQTCAPVVQRFDWWPGPGILVVEIIILVQGTKGI